MKLRYLHSEDVNKQLIPNWEEEFYDAWEEDRKPHIFAKFATSGDPFSDIEDEGESDDEFEPFSFDGVPDVVVRNMLQVGDPHMLYEYAKNVIGDRWPEAEPIIAKNPEWAYWYANNVIKDRWPEAEPVIKRDKGCWNLYGIRFGI